MKDRPILFSGPMVRAILAGTKTQTRRLGPYGRPGDRLWVKETYASNVPGCESQGGYSYRADHRDPRGDGPANPMRWRPSNHMPRAASRITLEVTSVRVERLQDITEEDAKAEGVTPLGDVGCPCEGENDDPGPHIARCPWADPDIDPDEQPFRASFRVLWDEINGKRAPWEANPWIWVVQFRRPA